MKTRIKPLKFIFVTIISVVVVTLSAYVWVTYIIPCSTAKNIPEMITVIVAMLNLMAIILFFCIDKKDKKTVKKEEYALYWYHNVFLQPNLPIIETFFEKYMARIWKIKNCTETEEVKVLFADLTNECKLLKDAIGYLLRSINSEQGEELLEFIENKLEDLVIEKMACYFMNNNKDFDEIRVLLKDIQLEMYEKLYQYGSRILE